MHFVRTANDLFCQFIFNHQQILQIILILSILKLYDGLIHDR